MSETTRYLKTTGLHCRSCAALVDITVGELTGVSDVSTDFSNSVTSVRFESDTITEAEIIEAIRSVGYDAELTE